MYVAQINFNTEHNNIEVPKCAVEILHPSFLIRPSPAFTLRKEVSFICHSIELPAVGSWHKNVASSPSACTTAVYEMLPI